jgi:glycine reductase
LRIGDNGMSTKVRVVHYLNQFFAQIGGEDKAEVGPQIKPGLIGPGRALQQALGEHGEIVATIFCGDNYFAEHQAQTIDQLIQRMAEYKPDLLIAGPAFESGRYGIACGAICQAAQQRLGIVAVAGMDEDNVGASLYRKNLYIINSGATIARMVPTIQRMAALGVKLARREAVGKPETKVICRVASSAMSLPPSRPQNAPSTCCWRSCAAMHFTRRSPRRNLPRVNPPRRSRISSQR